MTHRRYNTRTLHDGDAVVAIPEPGTRRCCWAWAGLACWPTHGVAAEAEIRCEI